MSRPSYLSRRGDGGYFIQIRLGKPAADLFGLPLFRVSLRTSNYAEARRRLVNNLPWVQELIDAPDLEAMGELFDARLRRYVDRGSPTDERLLSERCAFEHEVRRFIARAQERSYAYPVRFPRLPSLWVDFVDQNKASEKKLARIDVRRVAGGQSSITDPGNAQTPNSEATSVNSAAFDPIEMINRLVRDAVSQRMPVFAPVGTAPLAPTLPSVPNTSHQAESPAADTAIRMSDVLAEFLKPPGRKRMHTAKGRGEAGPVVQFAVDLLGNPLMNGITDAQWRQLDEALPDIPNRHNIPQGIAKTLFRRYQYAKDKNWAQLERVTTTTIKSRYWGGLYKFIDFAISENYYRGSRPTFECIDPENLAPLPRDAFDDEELLMLLAMPLFTGCKNGVHVWKPGRYFVQSHIYWGFLICILTGMRPGEVGQLKCIDIRTDGDFFYFDLRPFDARNGRVALQDLRNLKSNAAGRIVPIHPLLIELGLLDRMQDLMDAQEERLFPEWESYVRKDGTVRWSQPLSKAWQYVKKVLQIDRADLTLYSTRHLMADWLDNSSIAQRTRDRILGHASDVRGRYGRKGILDPKVAEAIEALEPPVVKKMRAILLNAKARADAGELIVLKPHLSPQSLVPMKGAKRG